MMLPTGHYSSQTLGNILVALSCFSRAMALEEGLRILTQSPLRSKQLEDVVEKKTTEIKSHRGTSVAEYEGFCKAETEENIATERELATRPFTKEETNK